MQTTRADVFALKNSGLDAFLYANIGAETNGSSLTILSVLARLGKDPWAEASRWTALPKSVVIDSLAQSIVQMPLLPQTTANARATAARLVQLLPANGPDTWHRDTSQAGKSTLQGWMTIILLSCAMAIALATGALVMPQPSKAVSTSSDQIVSVPGSSRADADKTKGAPAPAAPPPVPGSR